MRTSTSRLRRSAPPVATLVAAGGAVLAGLLLRLGGHTGAVPVLAFADPGAGAAATATRVVLTVATAVVAGLGLVRPLLGPGLPVRGTRVAAWVAGAVAAATCAVAVLTGQAVAVLGVALLALSLVVPASLARRLPPTLAGLALTAVLAVTLTAGREGPAAAFDVLFAVAVAALLGATVAGVGLDADAPVRPRLARTALLAGVLATAAGLAQLIATGPTVAADLTGTGAGVAALAVAVLPALATLSWLSTTRPGRRRRAPELNRLAAGGLAVSVAAAAATAVLPAPAAAPAPGAPLLRPVQVGLRSLAVLVTPMRPGPNLVHVGGSVDTAGDPASISNPIPTGHHSEPSVPSGTMTVGVPGGAEVPVTAREGASGGWAVLDLPADARSITLTVDGQPATVPVDPGLGTGPSASTQGEADRATQATLAGPDGPECAAAALGGLVAGGGVPDRPALPGATGVSCPSQALAADEGDGLADLVSFLSSRGVPGLTAVVDGSPRGTAAEARVRSAATRMRMPLTVVPTGAPLPVDRPADGLLVLTGWTPAVGALKVTLERAAHAPTFTGGTFLAPWLLTSGVLRHTQSAVLPMPFNPQDLVARSYAATLVGVFPGEGPSAGGYRAWAAQRGEPFEPRSAFYGAAPVDVPMGMDDMAMPHGGNPASWYPGGAVVPVNPPLTDPIP